MIWSSAFDGELLVQFNKVDVSTAFAERNGTE